MEQLSFDIKREQEELEYTYKNYDWLTGNPDNLEIFFKEQLVKNISPELKADAKRRLDLLNNKLHEKDCGNQFNCADHDCKNCNLSQGELSGQNL